MLEFLIPRAFSFSTSEMKQKKRKNNQKSFFIIENKRKVIENSVMMQMLSLDFQI